MWLCWRYINSYHINNLNPLQKVEIVSLAETKTITYWIDGEKKRSAKLVNGLVQSFFIYDKSERLIAELNPDFSIKSRFIYGTQGHSPDYMISASDNAKLFFVKDQLGSILQVVDTNGAVEQEINYDEFGVVLSDTNPGFQPFGFAGGHYDFETGFVRFGARDYDAEIGRWLERDPIRFAGGDTNLYGYVGNNPVNKIDPSGLQSCNPMVDMIGGINTGVNQVITPALNRAAVGVGYAAGGIAVGTGLFLYGPSLVAIGLTNPVATTEVVSIGISTAVGAITGGNDTPTAPATIPGAIAGVVAGVIDFIGR